MTEVNFKRQIGFGSLFRYYFGVLSPVIAGGMLILSPIETIDYYEKHKNDNFNPNYRGTAIQQARDSAVFRGQALGFGAIFISSLGLAGLLYELDKKKAKGIQH